MSMRFFVLSLVFVLASIGVSRASPLQQAIDKAPSGAVIALGPGFYEATLPSVNRLPCVRPARVWLFTVMVQAALSP